jgi:tRNA-dihydrouridine synthase A
MTEILTTTLQSKTYDLDWHRKLAVAPMMGWTDRHYRYMARLISPNALLYSVMITPQALLYGKQFHILDYNHEEHPVALQLGGSDARELAAAAALGQDYGYDEINLNCGCPSDRVQKGEFGACLMTKPKLVAECTLAMMEAVDVPVTVKTRIGVDAQDSYDFLCDFVGTVHDKGKVNTFIIHARKAWLNGLSPHENRTIPPLDWERVYRLKRDFPMLKIILNGGLKTTDDVQKAMAHCDGVMIGREAYQNPMSLLHFEKAIFGTDDIVDENILIERLLPYIEKEMKNGAALKDMTRHMLGLFQGQMGARQWRRILSTEAYHADAKIDVIIKAMRAIYPQETKLSA